MIDLHTHTTASDGTCTPQALIELAARARVNPVAVTDHDTVEAVPIAQQAGRRVGVTVIAGIELSAQRPGSGSVHVLGLYIDPQNPTLQAAIAFARQSREERNSQILARLARHGMTLRPSDLLAQSGGGIVGRAHIARALVARHFFPTTNEVFRLSLGNSCWAYVERRRLSPREIFAAVKTAGGLSVLAHPGLLEWEDGILHRYLGQWVADGLQGIEVDYPRHTLEQRERYMALARQYRLVATGGSDFHGFDVKPDNPLGHGSAGLPIDARFLPPAPGCNEARPAEDGVVRAAG